MTKEEVISKTNEVFEKSFEIAPERLKPEAHIFNDLGLDSLDIVDLVVGLQQKFAVTIRDDERVRNIRTLGDVYDFIYLLGQEGSVGGSPSK
ncbi:MAG: acyl carrier protein [Candidatus Omnitrophica bacterium]|nr:acyl carrier protein [Candidatus Omnitrophota bacterium]